MSSIMDELAIAEKIGGGGGGYVGKGKLSVGFKVYAQGKTPKETFFAFDPKDTLSMEKAKSDAKLFAEQNGAKVPTNASTQILIYKDSVKGRAVSWQDDRDFTVENWTDGYKMVIKPELSRLADEGKFTKLGEYWLRVSFKKDPSPKAKQKLNAMTGEMQDRLVAYVADIFSDEAAAEAAAGTSENIGDNNGLVDANENWNAVKGDEQFAQALNLAATKTKIKPKQVAEIHAVALEWGLSGADITVHDAELMQLAGIAA